MASEAPHFFKIILAHTLEEGKLDLPKKFVRKNGGSLSDNLVHLKLPDGAEWDVELKKDAGKLWFGKGWLEFMEFYSVKLGHFLVFRYEGNRNFHVLIFDLSATEIQYPAKRIPRVEDKKVFDKLPEMNVPKTELEDDDDSEENENDRKRRYKTEAAAYSLPNIKMKRKYNVCNAQEMEEPFIFKEPKMEKKIGRDQYNSQKPTKSEPPLRMQPLTTAQEIKVIKRASNFKSTIANPSFMVTMRPSYIQTGNYLSLPRNFAERYFKESVDVTLQLSNGRIWNVWCGVRWAFTRRRTELKTGWKRFAVDNNLQEGDVCVFELIKGTKITLKVAIFRVLDN